MKRLIGKKVKSSQFGYGEVVDLVEDGGGHQIFIEFREGIQTYSLEKMMVTKFVTFVDSAIQNMAEELCDGVPTKIREEIQESLPIRKMPLGGWPPIGYAYGDFNELIRGYTYGNVARDIYKKCSFVFFWEYSYIQEFKRGKLFYANGAAREYSVWMIPHNNMTRTHSKEWINYIYKETIEEEYLDETMYDESDDPRITFVKNHEWEYIFAGIYKHNPEKDYRNRFGHNVAVYDLISDHYAL